MANTPIDWNESPYDDPVFLRDILYGSGAVYFSLPILAQLWLEELGIVGLRELDDSSAAPRKRNVSHDAEVRHSREDLHPVRLEGHRQTFWLRLDGSRTARGYRQVEIFDEPLRTDTAVVAALTTLEAELLDAEQVRNVFSLIDGPLEGPLNKQIRNALAKQGDDTADRNPTFVGQGELRSLEFMLSLLRHYRPEFDSLARDEQLALLEKGCERIKALLKAARQLVAFLEYGEPRRNLRPRVENANKDVMATVLADVEDLKSLKIAERLSVRHSELTADKIAAKAEDKAVKKMIERGRNILEGALGKEGWRNQTEAMKAEVRRWESLDEEEREVELLAEEWSVPLIWARAIRAQGRKPHKKL